MSQSLKNLPPHIARELRRHVSPRPHPKRGAAALPGAPKAHKSYASVLLGCAVLTATAASLPLAAHYWIEGMFDRDAPLTAPQIRRGAYMNTGSKDMGRDPDWDFATGTSKHDADFLVDANKRQLPDIFLAVPAAALKKRVPVEKE